MNNYVIEQLNDARRRVKEVAEHVLTLRGGHDVAHLNETQENISLAFRHLEDASMRLGKAIQAQDGGASVYDRSTTVGA